MKTAIYIENGVTQLVLTPETEWEKAVTEKLGAGGEHSVTIFRGEFYENQAGYFRHSAYGTERSLILRVNAAVVARESGE